MMCVTHVEFLQSACMRLIGVSGMSGVLGNNGRGLVSATVTQGRARKMNDDMKTTEGNGAYAAEERRDEREEGRKRKGKKQEGHSQRTPGPTDMCWLRGRLIVAHMTRECDAVRAR
jgi:hypothetical protein